MKKNLRIGLVIVLVLFIGIQFIPIHFNQNSEDLNSEFTNIYDVPIKIKTQLQNSCYDCHSNNTKYPWYSKIQPLGFLLQQHIHEGKSVLNFSEFDKYSERRRKSKLRSIASQIRNNEMPLASYALIKCDAVLAENDKKEIIEWIISIQE